MLSFYFGPTCLIPHYQPDWVASSFSSRRVVIIVLIKYFFRTANISCDGKVSGGSTVTGFIYGCWLLEVISGSM